MKGSFRAHCAPFPRPIFVTMKNVTITLDDKTAAWAHRGTSWKSEVDSERR
jgi:hypothetical protein